jgi:DNA-binding transcriptional MocR family regulator
MTQWLPDLSNRTGPRYRAIADALADDIANNRLATGDRLPTHRDLAYHLKVTVGTVTRAYAEAERRGLIGGEVGRGTYVKAAAKSSQIENWPHHSPLPPVVGTAGEAPAVVNMSVCQPSPSDVAGTLAAMLSGMNDPALFPRLLTYSPHGGLPDHREAGTEWLVRQHRIVAGPESVLITAGGQNALATAFAALARAGEVILTERLTYFGVKAVTNTLGIRLEGVAIDEDGIVPESFEALCRQTAPRALSTVPTLHNPTTAITPFERRQAIAEIARRHGVTIIEDDVFGFLVPDAPPPYQVLAPDITIHVNSLSKSIASGLRIGFLVAPVPLIPRLEATIRALNYTVPPLMAEIAARLIRDGSANGFAAIQRDEARARQQLAQDILGHGPGLVTPSAGQHLWLRLPEPWRREVFVAEAAHRGVTVTGADAFMVGRSAAPHAVRVGVCMPPRREDVRRGLEILAETLASPAEATLSIV